MITPLYEYKLSNSYYIIIFANDDNKFLIPVVYSPSNEQVYRGTNDYFDTAQDIIVKNTINQFWDRETKPSIIKIGIATNINLKILNVKRYTLSGKVIDETTYNPIEGIKVSMFTKGNNGREVTTKTNKEGIYSLTVNILLKEDSSSPNEKPNIIFTDSKEIYSDYSLTPFYQDGNIKENLEPIKMVLIKKSIEEKKQQYKKSGNNYVKNALKKLPKSPEEALLNFLKSQIRTLISTLLPTLLNILLAFGVNALDSTLTNYCPKKSKLDELIKLRNKIVKDLNNLSKYVDTLLKTIGIAQGFISILQGAANLILLIPIPVAVPPGIGIPQSIIQKGADLVRGFKKLIDKFSNLSITLLMSLLIFKSIIALLLSILGVIDKLIYQCDSNTQLDDLNNELKLINDEINNKDESNKYINVRRISGFTLEVITLDENITQLARKQAIGKDSKGIILIKGEPSFSADEKILLDELEFYIISNNLKAY